MTASSDSSYLPTPPFASGWLPVPGGHRLYHEQRGCPSGIPVLILHGGPGSGCSPRMAGFFNPRHYRVILLDQRGAGKSLPAGSCQGNTTQDLIEDIERLRQNLGIDRWLVMGGSWGGTLASLYAAAHPAHSLGLLLRNPFLARNEDLDWFFGGARHDHPEAWQAWAALGAPEQPGAMLPWLTEHFDRQSAPDLTTYVTAWHGWECALARTPGQDLSPAENDLLQARFRLQLHYFRHACFIPERGVLAAAGRLASAHLSIHIVQGLADHVCPVSATNLLLAQLPNAGYSGIEAVGHDPYAPAMLVATLRLLESFAAYGRFVP